MPPEESEAILSDENRKKNSLDYTKKPQGRLQHKGVLQKMESLVKTFDDLFYPEYKDNWDNELFRKIILEKASSSKTALDLGAGAGIIEYMNVKGKFQKVCGVDLDQRVLTNNFLDEAKVGDINCLPYKENSFDLVFSANVLEHLRAPEKIFNEVFRVLKAGGSFLTKTPNKLHYVPFIAEHTPDIFHKKINKLRGRKEEDTFPTFYRVNTIEDQKKVAEKTGFIVEKLLTFEGRPEYLRMHFIPYLFGIFYEKLMNSSAIFSNFRVIIITAFKKP